MQLTFYSNCTFVERNCIVCGGHEIANATTSCVADTKLRTHLHRVWRTRNCERNYIVCGGHEIASLFGLQCDWFEINNKLYTNNVYPSKAQWSLYVPPV